MKVISNILIYDNSCNTIHCNIFHTDIKSHHWMCTKQVKVDHKFIDRTIIHCIEIYLPCAPRYVSNCDKTSLRRIFKNFLCCCVGWRKNRKQFCWNSPTKTRALINAKSKMRKETTSPLVNPFKTWTCPRRGEERGREKENTFKRCSLDK